MLVAQPHLKLLASRMVGDYKSLPFYRGKIEQQSDSLEESQLKIGLLKLNKTYRVA